MKIIKTMFNFLLQTIMWMLIGIIVIIASPILAWMAIKASAGARDSIRAVVDTVDEVRKQVDGARAQMDGDEILRRLQEGQE